MGVGRAVALPRLFPAGRGFVKGFGGPALTVPERDFAPEVNDCRRANTWRAENRAGEGHKNFHKTDR
jgi:hypothetical protein